MNIKKTTLAFNEFQLELDLKYGNKYEAIPCHKNGKEYIGYFDRHNPYLISDEIKKRIECDFADAFGASKCFIFCETPNHYDTFDELLIKTKVIILIINNTAHGGN